jgi:hypothetical protein
VTVSGAPPHVFTDADRFQPGSVTATTPMSPSRALTLRPPPTFDVPMRLRCPLSPYAAWFASFVQWPAVTKCLPPLASVAANPTEQLDSPPGHHGLPGRTSPACCTGALATRSIRTPSIVDSAPTSAPGRARTTTSLWRTSTP